MSSVLSRQPGIHDERLKIGLLLLFMLVITRLGWLSDDAFISFRTVRNFVEGYGLTWNPVERVQAYTHPLWLFLVAVAYACTREIFLTSILLSIALTSLAVARVLYRLTASIAQALAFIAMLLCSQAVLDYSSSGLESPLSYLLAAGFCVAWLQSTAGQRPIFRLFFLGGLLALNRLDLTLLVAPALAVALFQQRSGKTIRLAVAALLPLVLWEIFSLVYYGFPFPNTYYAKLGTGIPEREYLAQGLIYLVDILAQDPATLLIVFLAVALAAEPAVRGRQMPLALGLVFYLAYVVFAGGDFMQGRFLCVPAFIAAIMLTQRANDARPLEWSPLPAAALIAAIAATRLFHPEGPDMPIRANGVADERRFYFDTTALIHYHRGLRVPDQHPWAIAGAKMRDDANERVFVFGTVGFAGYAAGPAVTIVDFHALSDPFLARLSSESPWRIGHFARIIPPGYLESLHAGQNRFQDPKLAALYDQVVLVTRGPLFSWARFKAIWAMNTGNPGAADQNVSQTDR